MAYKVGLVAFALLVAGCSEQDPLEKAKARVAFLEQHDATLGEICDARELVQAAALEQQSPDYEMLRSSARIACMIAEQQGRDMPADADERKKINDAAFASTNDADNAVAEAEAATARAMAAADSALANAAASVANAGVAINEADAE